MIILRSEYERLVSAVAKQPEPKTFYFQVSRRIGKTRAIRIVEELLKREGVRRA